MAFDNTVTEMDLDADTQFFVEGLGTNGQDDEPDLAVDGLSESILSRLFSFFGIGRKRH